MDMIRIILLVILQYLGIGIAFWFGVAYILLD